MHHLSSPQQLLIFVREIINSFENKRNYDVIYLDFKKAFDSVPHRELLHKLRSVGVWGSLWKWFENYLASRLQCVAINGSVSELLPVMSGVPQGSILGPLLFIIYINDLPVVIQHSTILLFTDDTKCAKSVASQSEYQQVQNYLDFLDTWSHTWNLPFNENKFRFLQFSANASKDPHPHPYSIKGHNITPSTSHKDLGILFTNTLNWVEHCNLMTSRAYRQLGLLRRTFPSPNISARKKLYLSLIRSKLTYCSPVWRPSLIKHIELLETVQRRATKFILNNSELDYKSRLVHLNIFPLMLWYELADIMLLVKCIKNPDSRLEISKYITFSTTNTRSASFLKLSHHHHSRTNLSRHFYFNRVCRLWNALPPIDLNLSSNTIKAKIKKYLWSFFVENFNQHITCSFHFACPCAKCLSLPLPTNYSPCP